MLKREAPKMNGFALATRMTRAWWLLLTIFLIFLATKLFTGSNNRPAESRKTQAPGYGAQDNGFWNVTGGKQNIYKGVQLPTNYEELFFRADMKPMIDDAIEGAPFQYLSDYRNPCWLAKIVPDTSNPKIKATPKLSSDMRELYKERLVNGDNWRLRCVPLVHQIGFAKSGTTDLFTNLVQHPDLLSTKKEPLFWSLARYGDYQSPFQFVRTLPEYIDINDEAAEQIRKQKHRVILDASTIKIFYMDGWRAFPGQEHAAEPKFTTAMTTKALVPNAKLIVIMRDPVERTYSRFRFYHRRESTLPGPEVFHKHVSGFMGEMAECLRHQTIRGCAYNYTHFTNWNDFKHEKNSAFIRGSLYYVYVKDWLDVFPRDQIHFVLAEEYYRDRPKSVRDIYRFLDLDPDILSPEQYEDMKHSSIKFLGKEYEPMMNATRTLLREFFVPYNRMLAQLLHDKRSSWE